VIKINPMPPPVDAALLTQLAEADTNDIGHLRFWGVMTPQLRPISDDMRVVGTCVTVIAPAIDSSMIPHVLGMTRPGDVLVIDRLGDDHHACLGSVVALAAQLSGVSGIIIDGYATDFAELRELKLPIWCRGEAAAMSKLLGIAGAINVPVCCGGVAVTPGDAVLADRFGVCILPPQEIESTIAAVSQARQKRPARLERVKSGEKLGVINGVSPKIEAQLRATKQN
jgi:4-hydroxy-4-methyl-2-oxoglutarate aldolase